MKNGKCQTLFSQPAPTPFQDKLQVPEMPMQVLTAFVPGMEVVISAISSYLSTNKLGEGGAGPLLQKRTPNVGLERRQRQVYLSDLFTFPIYFCVYERFTWKNVCVPHEFLVLAEIRRCPGNGTDGCESHGC